MQNLYALGLERGKTTGVNTKAVIDKNTIDMIFELGLISWRQKKLNKLFSVEPLNSYLSD